jgi:Flp pilus assembly protein TadB
MTIKVKSNVPFLQVFMFGIICMGIGAILCFFILTQQATTKSLRLIRQQERQVNELVELTQYLRTWKRLVDDRFIEQDAKIRRLNHLMRVPASERHGAAERYDLLEDYGK